MRLTSIKLAGFKSFVDPTTISLPGQLVGIVGPNGCGKSNVIDAVRWVLGESKASELRGESMDDVIFNGAGERKPVARASVELIFDNASGRAAGQWSQYAELSVKRVLQRDVGSSYYINNQPVRRRDILDVFLGTGLGPRAYAVIGQGMISRIIEAKPEELRVFLEEAAGVSRYKERRKETESRLADTRENLARVSDIQTELTSQVERLEVQAKVASRYRELAKEKTESQVVLYALRRDDATKQRDNSTRVLSENETEFIAKETELQRIATEIEGLRQDVFTKNEAQHKAQGAFYEINSEVSRIEQQIHYERDRAQRVAAELEAREAKRVWCDEELVRLGDAIGAAEEGSAEAAAKLEHQQELVESATASLPIAETALRTAATALADVQQAIAALDGEAQIVGLKKTAAEKAIAQLDMRVQRLQQERSSINAPGQLDFDGITEALESETAELVASEEAVAEAEAIAESSEGDRERLREAMESAARTLADVQNRQKFIAAEQAKFDHGGEGAIADWLRAKGVGDTRFWSLLKVDAGWEDALEALLRDRLNAAFTKDLQGAATWGTPPSRLTLVSAGHVEASAASATDPAALLAKVSSAESHVRAALSMWLHGVFTAESLDEALHRRSQLSAGQSIVTRQGHVVTSNSTTYFAPDEAVHGALARRRELEELSGKVSSATESHKAASQAFNDAERRYQNARIEAQQRRSAIASIQRRVQDLTIERMQLEQSRKAANARVLAIDAEVADIQVQRESDLAVVQEQIEAHALIEGKKQDAHSEREIKRGVRNEADVALVKAREALRAAEISLRDLMYAERSATEKVQSLKRQVEATRQQAADLQTEIARLREQQSSILLTPIESSLQALLNTRTEREAALKLARDEVEAANTTQREVEERRLLIERELDPIRKKIEDARVKQASAEANLQQAVEQLEALQFEPAWLEDALTRAPRVAELQRRIVQLDADITQLGAVNLAALDELSQAAERKQYLDAQAGDLNDAVNTLEDAIRKIDRETRALLQETYDKVNAQFGRLFPTLFGGGQAKLVLTGDEILDAGIQVVAQPPGKRNSSIHLLSGGEKALTATALVFALFQLNPAPFCLLDEVDAPLDDPNTERFCKLVREMSSATQFLFISHNKIAMEMAEQLIGVTMNEPGVSRIVGVDVSQALRMAEAA
ncbi:MAG: chromosome segregation protein SMC [Betaproteobacteria bacterium]|nr:MAG: chromosome segregation protein SMC [Betaproteobacteria bacterium]